MEKHNSKEIKYFSQTIKKMTNKKPHIKPTTKHRNQNILNKFYNAYIKSKNNTQT